MPAATSTTEPLAAVLAGGAATRLGGAKATLELAGRPLIAYPLAALAEAGIETVVVAKADTELPATLGVPVLTEPSEPRHPLVGIVTALGHARGRAVLACACDLPLVTPALMARLAGAPAPAAVSDGRRLHPTLALYPPSAAAALGRAAADGRPATEALTALDPTIIEVSERETFNVNTREDIARATRLVTGADR
jgi:molybdenum cofactor guanylyltransferase